MEPIGQKTALSSSEEAVVTTELDVESGENEKLSLLCRIDTDNEVDYYLNGGILPYVLRQLAAA